MENPGDINSSFRNRMDQPALGHHGRRHLMPADVYSFAAISENQENNLGNVSAVLPDPLACGLHWIVQQRFCACFVTESWSRYPPHRARASPDVSEIQVSTTASSSCPGWAEHTQPSQLCAWKNLRVISVAQRRLRGVRKITGARVGGRALSDLNHRSTSVG